MNRIISIFLPLLLSFSNVLSFVRYFSVHERISISSNSNARMLRMSDEVNLVAKVRQTVKPGIIVLLTFFQVLITKFTLKYQDQS